jgi:hypothetical protein
MDKCSVPGSFTAELAPQPDPAQIGDEVVRIRFDDGTTREFRLHDYEELFALPGVYEQIVHERLGCRSPTVVAGLLAETVDRLGWDRSSVRVIDIAAGNGVSGEELALAGLHPVLGTDLVDAARLAAVRDRPGLYDEYLTLDLLALTDQQRATLEALHANVLCCVAPIGEHQVPVTALTAVAALLEPDALVAYLHEVPLGQPDDVTPAAFGSDVLATELVRRRYIHRYTVTGRPFEMDAVVWRVRQAQ